MNRRGVPWSSVLVFGCLIVSVSALASPPEPEPAPRVPDEIVSDGRIAMGTVLEISVLGRSPARASAFIEECFAEVERLETILSSWNPSSDLSKLNALAASEAASVRVPAELAEVLLAARSVSGASGGAFDVTIGPLLDLWRKAEETNSAPSESALAGALARVGRGQMLISADRTISLRRPGMRIDLGGIAKGYAFDHLAAIWQGDPAGSAALLSFGQSTILAIGAPSDAPGWRLRLRSSRPGTPYLGEIVLRDRALSMSSSVSPIGNERGGEVVSHIVDPRTGRPVGSGIEAVVVAPSATWADAVATAIVVMGPREGLEWAEGLADIEALIIDANADLHQTSGFERSVLFSH